MKRACTPHALPRRAATKPPPSLNPPSLQGLLHGHHAPRHQPSRDGPAAPGAEVAAFKAVEGSRAGPARQQCSHLLLLPCAPSSAPACLLNCPCLLSPSPALPPPLTLLGVV